MAEVGFWLAEHTRQGMVGVTGGYNVSIMMIRNAADGVCAGSRHSPPRKSDNTQLAGDGENQIETGICNTIATAIRLSVPNAEFPSGPF